VPDRTSLTKPSSPRIFLTTPLLHRYVPTCVCGVCRVELCCSSLLCRPPHAHDAWHRGARRTRRSTPTRVRAALTPSVLTPPTRRTRTPVSPRPTSDLCRPGTKRRPTQTQHQRVVVLRSDLLGGCARPPPTHTTGRVVVGGGCLCRRVRCAAENISLY
jgi:hypothetical protein